MFEHAAQTPLVTVTAGPGYGKTNEAACFAQNTDGRLIWIHINRLDDITDHFWRSLTNAAQDEFPILARKLSASGFPDTAIKFNSFLREFAAEIYNGPRLIFVVDDFGRLKNGEILSFFERIIEAQLENFCLMLITSAKTDIGLAGLRHGGLFQITADDLKFTLPETKLFFVMSGLGLSEDELREMNKRADGWPMALYMFAQRFDPNRIYEPGQTNIDIINALFERDFFSNYSEDIQRTLVKLSMVQSFSSKLVRMLGASNPAETEDAVAANIFVAFDSSSHLYTFQNMYRAFLVAKQEALDEGEKRELWSAAGDVFFETGHELEAIDCFEKCARHDQLFQSIAKYYKNNVAYSRERANFLLEKLDALPKDFVHENPLADFIRATMLVNNLELEAATEILCALTQRISGSDDLDSRVLRGEAYWMMGGIHMLRCDPDYVRYFKMSYECFPDGSPAKSAYLHVGNVDSFNICDNQPGALERMERAIHEAIPYFSKIAHGGGSGFEHLFSSEASYFTFDFNAVKQHAHKAIYAAMEASQHDILCNAHIILSRAAIMQGDYKQCKEHVEFVRDYINEREIVPLYEMRDCAMAGLYVAVGDFSRMERWLTTPDTRDMNRPPFVGCRDKIIQAEYLIGSEKYYEALAFLDHYEKMYQRQGRWVNVLKCLVMHSVVHMKTGDMKSAANALCAAYDMSHDNGIITPFVESAGNMRALTDHIRKSGGLGFDPDWLDSINRKSAVFAKRLSLLTSEYSRNVTPAETPEQKLSRREASVLGNLSQGLTREEIANTNNISVNTVKSVITSAYNKLGAINRADAVRIATTLGILK
ncbi:MAG: LuxR C-terminal-related transcriptional regulator [Synergistaceae bacterium]|nr:LuxR C-terminal-related transcriptional regulator [Synergistaceae bacterium]